MILVLLKNTLGRGNVRYVEGQYMPDFLNFFCLWNQYAHVCMHVCVNVFSPKAISI